MKGNQMDNREKLTK